MSIARDDAGNIRELHKTASGLSRNFRDASGGTGGTRIWQKDPTPIHTPGKGLGSNPYSGRMTRGDARQVEGRDGKAGSSSTSRLSQTTKRRKLEHLQGDVSKYFSNENSVRRGSRAIPSTSTSSRPSSTIVAASVDPIIIDAEDDAPATDDDSHEPIVLRTPSPDQLDVISPNTVSYSFDQNKPSPMDAFSSSLEEKRKSPQDGESTLRVRNVVKKSEMRTTESVSRPDSDGDDVLRLSKTLPVLLSRNATAQAEASSGGGYVKRRVAYFDGIEGKNKNASGPRYINLEQLSQSRKNGMKPKQVPRRDIPALPIQHLDPDATRSSGFASGTKPSTKGKAAANGRYVHIPLKEWSIAMAIPSQEATSGDANLVWEAGVLKVRHVNGGSIPFELQVKKGSLNSVKYVDIKRTTTTDPLIQICPSVVACVKNHTQHSFKPGSTDPDGLLTFKFDTSASGWDSEIYTSIVQKLIDSLASKDGKSILDGSGARAVWEVVTRGHEDMSIMNDPEPEPMVLDIPKENPPNPPSKPRPRPRPRSSANEIADIFVRRSARLSGVEEEQISPRPDPDEVILGYRSGTGSLNITNGDVSRLKPGEFLNDTLIEFGLKLWLADLQESNPELASQVHVFSSFFYKKLSTKIPEEGYNSVRKWTSKFDLFQKKYIVVPINENLHWYLAIIYFPEYTLLPPPVQVTNVQARRSTRRLGVVIDSPEAQQSEPAPAPRQSLPPDLGPSSNGGVDSVCSTELVDLESSKTDDQMDEFAVERMVASTLTTPVDTTANQVDEQQQVDTVNASTSVTYCPESPMLAYPQSSPPCHPAMLLSSDPPGDSAEQSNQVELAGVDTSRTSGIAPSTFYGTSTIMPQGPRDLTPPQIAPIDVNAMQEIEIDEDETVGNPDSEPEQTAEHPRTYIYTFDSLASKHPQAVKRLSRYLLMEAHDKKQLAEDALTEPKGMQAIVPHQPNYCDCGIYLLHFAKTFMKDPRASSDIIRNRRSPQKGRRVPHEHWDRASVGTYREELTARIRSMSEEWKKQRGEQDSGTKNQPDGVAPQQEQPPRGDAGTPTVSSKAENDDSDSDIEVLGFPQKPASSSKAPRRDNGLSETKKGPAARVRG